MSLAFHHVLGGAIDEQLLRTYASRSEATAEGCKWLAGARFDKGQLRSPRSGAARRRAERRLKWLGGAAAPRDPGLRRTGIRVVVSDTEERWYLVQPDSTVGALLVRHEYDDRKVKHYAGEKGAERMVRCERPSGVVAHFEGEKGAERLVRIDSPDQTSGKMSVCHLEGENGAEHLVRIELPSGEVSKVQHFEGGELGTERLVRLELSSGELQHYEGERDSVRLVRCELPSGEVQHYEGESGAVRLVRCELSSGEVQHYEGERDSSRLVRCELPYGGVIRFERDGIGYDL